MYQRASPVPGAERSPSEGVQLSWSQPGGMVGLGIVNFLLRLVTFGIYHFWGKTEVRRRIWSAIRLQGEPLEYTGTGKELFLGFLVVFAVVLVPMLLLSLGAAFLPEPAANIASVVPLAFYFLLVGFGLYRAQRYRLSRTRWRGIRGSLAGNGWTYGWTYFWTLLLVPFTLGWIVPWRTTVLQRLITNDMRFGDRPLRFTGGSGPIYRRFAAVWLGAIALYTAAFAIIVGLIAAKTGEVDDPQLALSKFDAIDVALILGTIAGVVLLYGVISAWYRAGMINHFAAHTHFEGATFKAHVMAPSLIWLGVTNFLLVLLTLGLLAPVAQSRTTRYLVERLELRGPVDLGAIVQGADLGLRTGEGVAQAFDVDAL